ncbi:MAG: DUF2341 domain-containing protein, partial [Thermodesulfovibrionia bacterium]|nr:DUF2341 domain-containing protein [Thermodesulfovibrionia bacterium]
MKKNKAVLILMIFMFLYIGPIFLAPSYGQSATPTQTNIVKDFTPATGWYGEFSYRKLIRIYGSVGAGTDYQVRVNVTYESGMQADFDDIVFTDNDNVTQLDHWLEYKVDSVFADVWVEVADDLENDLWLMMYYGDPSASSLSDGEATFPFFDDFEDGSFDTDLWTEESSGGSYTEAGGYLKVMGGSPERIVSDTGFGNSYSFMMRDMTVTAKAVNKYLYAGIYNFGTTDFALFQSYNNVERFTTYDTGEETNAWSDFTAGEDFEIRSISAARTEFFVNDVLLFLHSTEETATDKVFDFEVTGAGTSGSDYIQLDTAFVRNCIAIEPELAFWGPEESNPYEASWHVVASISFWFTVDIDEWGLNVLLIILGLVMIPTSGLYLAYGVKHDRSSDRLFYGLMIFILGCGLFIGG